MWRSVVLRWAAVSHAAPVTLILTLAGVLLAAVLLSAQANRTIMSTAVTPGDDIVSLGAELAHFVAGLAWPEALLIGETKASAQRRVRRERRAGRSPLS